jgi:fimbrial chaperone protein
MRPHRLLVAGAALLPLLLPRIAAAAGQLQAGPTLVEIGPRAAATRLTLRNTGDSPVAAQVRVFRWTQLEGADSLLPTEEMAVSPPIVELPAGGEQVVRIVRIGLPPEAGRDDAYRVIVDELPGAGGRDTRVALRMRYVLPLFVRGSEAAPPRLSCAMDAAGSRLECANGGGRPAQLGASRLVDARGRTAVLSEGLFGYVLPGRRRVWLLEGDRPQLDFVHLRLETWLNGRPTVVGLDPAL